ncbi:MAG TPA: acyltransferase [Pyrinomonadaceae bacterium]|nr:acyltransferase [Pyrinomonadaceae bacterium]
MPAPPNQSPRLRSIDALRGIAALGVVFYHAVEQGKNVLPNNLFDYPIRLLQFISSFGYIGVFLFFVISGFCIHLQWAKARATGIEPDIRFGPFWKRRLRRLYPPYVIALALFLLVAYSYGELNLTRFFFYDIGMHLLMLHNLDPQTCYTINGVFWTLAIEEQLYLAYFLLLFVRVRWGWRVTIAVCLAARVAWMLISYLAWVKLGYGLPVPEAALSHWFTWALGAIGVELMFGLIQLPRWSRDLRLGMLLIVGATALSYFMPGFAKDTFAKHVAWFFLHPLWGLGFFIVINRLVLAEQSWIRRTRVPSAISIFAALGIFSYSLYLTHELVVIVSWRFTNPAWLQSVNVLLLTVPATIFFAWIFFRFCERPFMIRRKAKRAEIQTVETRSAWTAIPESQPSTVSD